MAKITLNNLSSLTNEASAIAIINANNDAIEVALEKTLSRDGTSPNTMSDDLDMDSNRILNHPDPVNDSDLVTKGWADDEYGTTAVSDAESAAAAAEASAAEAEASALAAATAETNAETAEANAEAAQLAAEAAQAAAEAAGGGWSDVVFHSSSTLTLTTSDVGKFYVFDTTSNNITVTLPTISGDSPLVYGIKKAVAANSLILNRSSTNVFTDGSTSLTFTVAGSGTTLLSDTTPNPDEWTNVDFGPQAGNVSVTLYEAGTDFTAGTTDALTLVSDPGTENNVVVTFDGLVQHRNGYSVSGTTLTFSAAIPTGVNEVEISIVSTLSIGTPADGSVTTAKIDDLAVTEGKLADSAVATAKIEDDAVTLAKMASGTDGQVLTYDSSGNPTAVGPGTSGQLLTSNGAGAAPSFQDAPVATGAPTGSLMPFAGTTEPSGWLFCYGQAVSRTTYADLFTALSTTYGVGDGSTTFTLPDLRGRTVAGKDDMGSTSANRLTNQTGGLNGDTLGATGGSETHTLTNTQIPTGFVALNSPSTIEVQSGTGANPSNIPVQAGANGAHNNVQPTIILNYIIKT